MRDLLHVPQSRIVTGHNPRRYFDEEELSELTESVRENGILQPVIVRRTGEPGQYTLVAGERRLRALRAAFPDEDRELPAIVLGEQDDHDAVSVIENTQRADMSPAEESIAVVKLIQKFSGNKDEVARVLGWSKQKVVKRAALSLCTTAVLDALTERKILLGHAELLALVPKEKQDDVLPKVVEHDITVSDLKKRLQAYCLVLSTASFDKTQCQTCRHNSGNQRSLFVEAVEDGHCGNPSCFEAKTQEHLDTLKAQMQETYNRVEVVGPGEEIFVEVSESLVGPDQFNTGCKACANFGCAIHSAPGLVGNTESPVCFDSECNIKMRSAFKKASQPAPVPVADGAVPEQDKLQPASSTSTAAPSAPACCKPAQPATSGKLVEYRRKVNERAVILDAKKNGTVTAMVIALTAKNVRPDHSVMDKVAEKFSAESLSAYLDLLTGQETAAGPSTGVLSALVRGCSVEQVRTLVSYFHINLRDYWQYDAEFLDCLTKAQIDALLDEIGYAQSKSDEDLKKIVSGKKSAIVQALLADPAFTECTAVPACMHM